MRLRVVKSSRKYPDGVMCGLTFGYNNEANTVTREDGITYNKKEHLWYEINGDLHSRK
jgi:hypothetical protein